ncbi:hemin-degrading factor [Thalassolituus alkanivorans]|jgi:putative hemin transport protein|uniref:hemin-degrading factor n=1 Tax=Thalassolituus alkanivorans TaxID=2881055 RepID=UPI001E289B60|nr:ChuX/HutX family heme-like substrate-binding protein [Thalassolituus alkanivorans]MCB2388136.1 hemin-degrading factor [Thalassolituus alkanivorans]MCB2424675.1 hemin-degrading factor [Thalassolituus alkanivorans]
MTTATINSVSASSTAADIVQFFSDLARRWQALRDENEKLRIRNAAEQLGVSEAELLATRVGNGVTRLNSDFKKLFTEVESLGSVMALTRNDAMVHEKTGQYKDLSIHGNMGLALGVIDLRIFFSRFVYGFAVQEGAGNSMRESLQFFNAQGEAVHKIYANTHTDMQAFRALVERYRAAEQSAFIVLERNLPEGDQAEKDNALLQAPAQLNVQQLRKDWSELKDVHHFQAMLKKHQLERIPAYRAIGADYAQQLDKQAFEDALLQAAASELPIMVFVGSEGMVQIHTGPVKTLLRTGPWFNVLDPDFNLHANTQLLDQVWLVRKPTTDGVVSALEMFDAEGKQVALLFGERKPGKPELEGWRELLNKLLAKHALAVNSAVDADAVQSVAGGE